MDLSIERSSDRDARRFRIASATAAGMFLVASSAILTHAGGDWTRQAVRDLSYLVFVATACATAIWSALHTTGRLRKAWSAIAVGLAAGVAGEERLGYYQAVLRPPQPLPSPAQHGDPI